MTESLHQWHEVADTTAAALPEGKITEVTAGGRKVCLLRKEGRVYAFAATCPHSGAPFCSGWLDARGHVVCPLHKYRFDPANGRNTSGEGYKLRTYPVDIREGIIFIGLIASTI